MLPLFRRIMVRKTWAALFAASLLMCFVSCSSKRVGEDVSATVDGRKIYRTDVEKYYQRDQAKYSFPQLDVKECFRPCQKRG